MNGRLDDAILVRAAQTGDVDAFDELVRRHEASVYRVALQRTQERLKWALALTLGIESIIIMKDICRLDDDQALANLRWAAKALLRAGLEEPPAP